MSRRCIWIVEQPDALLIKGRGAGDLLRGGGFKPYYVGIHRAFMLDRHRQADPMANLESRGVPYQVTARVMPREAIRPEAAMEDRGAADGAPVARDQAGDARAA